MWIELGEKKTRAHCTDLLDDPKIYIYMMHLSLGFHVSNEKIYIFMREILFCPVQWPDDATAGASELANHAKSARIEQRAALAGPG